MKKISLLILFFSFTFPCFAEDYYVYVRTFDRYHTDTEQNKGRSKQGDIVEIAKVKKDEFGNDRLPTDREQQEYAIYRVNNLPDTDRVEFRKGWVENENTDNEITKAYRRYKIEGVEFTPGYKGAISGAILRNQIKLKTNLDIARYERGRKLYAFAEPVRKFYRKFIEPFAYAAETISTINRTGETYGTITLWEDAKDGDITAGNAEVAECYNDDGTLSDTVVFLGWTTDADSYVKIIAPKVASVGGTNERHSGTIATGFNVTGISAGAKTFTLQSGLDVYFEGLIIGVNHSTTTTPIGIDANALTTNIDLFVSYCIFYDTNPGTGSFPQGLRINNTEATAKIWNNIFYDFDETDGTTGRGMAFDGAVGDVCTAYIYNNTVYGCDIGFNMTNDANTTTTIKNNIANGNGTDYAVGWDTTNGFNVSEDATSPDVAYRSKAVTFDNEAGDDFTVDDSPNDTTLDDGEDLSADATIAFSDDIEAITRSPWYIGASEGPAAGGVAMGLQPIINIF